ELLDVEYGRLHAHQRTLDLRRGVLERHLEWESPAGTRATVSSTRLVSFTHRAVAAIRYEVSVDHPARIAIQSELVANEVMEAQSADPRAAAALSAPLVSRLALAQDMRAILAHSTRSSGLLMAASMDHIVDGPSNLTYGIEAL